MECKSENVHHRIQRHHYRAGKRARRHCKRKTNLMLWQFSLPAVPFSGWWMKPERRCRQSPQPLLLFFWLHFATFSNFEKELSSSSMAGATYSFWGMVSSCVLVGWNGSKRYSMDRYNPVQARYTGIMCAIVWQSQIKCCICSCQIDELRMFIHGRHKAVHLLFVIREANHTSTMPSNNVSIVTQSISSFDPQEFPSDSMKECRVPQNQPSTLHKTSSFSIISGKLSRRSVDANSPSRRWTPTRYFISGAPRGVRCRRVNIEQPAGRVTTS